VVVLYYVYSDRLVQYYKRVDLRCPSLPIILIINRQLTRLETLGVHAILGTQYNNNTACLHNDIGSN